MKELKGQKMMDRIEKWHNSLSDKRFIWWPFTYLKPEPSTAINQNVTWSSSNENVAVVDNNGFVSALGEGLAIITVTTEDGGFTATCDAEVTILNIVASVIVEPNESTVEIGATVQLVSTVSPYCYSQEVVWTSSDLLTDSFSLRA